MDVSKNTEENQIIIEFKREYKFIVLFMLKNFYAR